MTARPGVLRRIASALGTLLSRDIAVLTNAIAFNFLLCLFPLLLVLAAFAQRYQGSRAGAALLLLLQELIPFDQEAIAASLKSLTRIARGLEVFSLLLIVWGSSGIFMPVEMALNRAWGGRPDRHFLAEPRPRVPDDGRRRLPRIRAPSALTVTARTYGRRGRGSPASAPRPARSS